MLLLSPATLPSSSSLLTQSWGGSIRGCLKKSPNIEECPNIVSPAIENPNVKSPYILSPDAVSPDAVSPNVESPNVESPNVASPTEKILT